MRETVILIAIAAARILLHLLTNGNYGFHRDELATLDDARHMAWGFVAYPPLTPAVARLALEVFGASLVGIRFFASLAQGVAVVLTGRMARDLGGGARAQIFAGLAVAIAPVSVGSGTLFQYVAFDYLWWVTAAWCMIRLLRSEDPRWWLAVGAAIGAGMLTKYTMGFLALGIAVGVVATDARRYLRSPFLWAGAALAVTIFLPNLMWQMEHQFISLEFLQTIHARDVRIGRADGFLPHQLYMGGNPFILPLWVIGLYWYFAAPAGRRFRSVGWMYVVPLLLFVLARGRDYYLAPAYPMLLAAGCVAAENWVARFRALTALAFAAGAALVIAVVIPIAPVNSAWWSKVGAANSDWCDEIGWPELVETVARIRDGIPAADRASLGILVGNYGEAGAINLFGPAYGLPPAISGTNTAWLRGYPQPPPETLIVVGFTRAGAERVFTTVELAGRNTNRYGVKNEESRDHPDIFVCRGMRIPWAEFWKKFRRFG